jgi:hypothetical protein
MVHEPSNHKPIPTTKKITKDLPLLKRNQALSQSLQKKPYELTYVFEAARFDGFQMREYSHLIIG